MRKGFTLLELIVVMGIIGTLIGIGISSYTNSLNKARDAKRKADLHQIQIALEEYKQQNGFYPSTQNVQGGWLNSLKDGVPNQTPWISDLADFMKTMPVDPKNVVESGASPDKPKNYIYAYYSKNDYCPNIPAGDYYILSTRLENAADHDAMPTYITSGCQWPTDQNKAQVYALSNP